MEATLQPRSSSALAVGGVAGPAGFVAAWAVLGATRPGYSPVRDAISRLAEVGASTRPAMNAGFVAFGIGVPLYALALRRAIPGRAWMTAMATGLATLGVAAAPLGVSPGVDRVHGAFAGIGYATLAVTPWLAAPQLAAQGRTRAAMASRAVALASGASLVATTIGPAHGFFQRAGLGVGDVWIVATAAWIIGRRRG